MIGDFNHDPTGTYYPKVAHFAGTQSATVQWDDDPDLINVNGTAVSQSLASSDLIRVFDVSLSAGTTYTFDFFPQGGSGAHMPLFRNTGGGVYWVGRAAAQFDVTGPTTFVAPTSGYYGVVVTNDAATSFTYALGITSSACGIPTALGPGRRSTSPRPRGTWRSTPSRTSGWVSAVRPNAGDWDVQTYGLPSGAAAPVCFSTLLANSALGGGVVDITIGDFNTTPFGWYFGYSDHVQRRGGLPGAVHGHERRRGRERRSLSRSMVATDVAQTFDVFLQGGRTYALTFVPTAGMSMLMFANTGGGSYIAGRGAAVVSSNTSTTYTAPVSGWYGIAIVNDGAVAGSYHSAWGTAGW